MFLTCVFLCCVQGVGKLLGYYLGSLDLVGGLGAETQVQALYGFAAAIVIAAATATTVAAREDVGDSNVSTGDAVKASFRDLAWTTLNMPTPIARAFVVQSCSYFAWFCTFIYLSDW